MFKAMLIRHCETEKTIVLYHCVQISSTTGGVSKSAYDVSLVKVYVNLPVYTLFSHQTSTVQAIYLFLHCTEC
jgi:hypothetical protein